MFWEDLKDIGERKYDIEKRDNSIQDEETYRIFWGINEDGENLERTDSQYCLQTLIVTFKKDIGTYEIKQIILNDN